MGQAPVEMNLSSGGCFLGSSCAAGEEMIENWPRTGQSGQDKADPRPESSLADLSERAEQARPEPTPDAATEPKDQLAQLISSTIGDIMLDLTAKSSPETSA